MSLVTSEGDTLFISAALTDGWREAWSQNEKPNKSGRHLCALLVTRPYAQTLIMRDSGREGLWAPPWITATRFLFCWIKTLPMPVASSFYTQSERCFHFPVGVEWTSEIAACLLFWTLLGHCCDPSDASRMEALKLESRPTEGRLVKTVTSLQVWGEGNFSMRRLVC